MLLHAGLPVCTLTRSRLSLDTSKQQGSGGTGGRVVVVGDSTCIDSAKAHGQCWDLMLDAMECVGSLHRCRYRFARHPHADLFFMSSSFAASGDMPQTLRQSVTDVPTDFVAGPVVGDPPVRWSESELPKYSKVVAEVPGARCAPLPRAFMWPQARAP